MESEKGPELEVSDENINENNDLDKRAGALAADEMAVPVAPKKQLDLQRVVFSHPVDHRGTQLHVKAWLQSETCAPPIIIVHEIGETMSLYRDLALGLAEIGYSVFAYDQRGHGRSGGHLGHVDFFGEFVNDLMQIAAWARFKCERQKPLIIAHGLSAIVVLEFLAKMPELANSAIFIAPGFQVQMSRTKRLIAYVMGEILPRFRLMRRLTPKSILSAQSQTPRVSARLVVEVVAALKRLPQTVERVKVPTWTLQPTNRSRYDYSNIESLLGSSNSLHTIMPHAFRHRDLFLDNPNFRDFVLEHVTQWFPASLAATPPPTNSAGSDVIHSNQPV